MFPSNVFRRCRNLAPLISRGRLSRLPISKVFRIQTNPFSSKSMKIAILGAASKTGSCLALFLKQSSLIDELAVFDNRCTYGLALDLNYIDTRCKVSTCNYPDKSLEQTLRGAKVVMIVADRSIKEETKPDEVLKSNADTLSDLLPNVIKYCPQAMVAVVMNPINSLIPVAMEMYKKAGVYEHNRLFGVISLDCLRANTFAAEIIGLEPEYMIVPVIGGSCPHTCIPLFSHAKPCNRMTSTEARRLTQVVRVSDDEITRASRAGNRTFFATAFAAARFGISLCKALRHQSNVVECAYVRSCVIPEITYFAAPLELGPNGIQRYLGVPPLNDFECDLLKAAIPRLKRDISLGEALALGEGTVSTEICPKPTDKCDRQNPPRPPSP